MQKYRRRAKTEVTLGLSVHRTDRIAQTELQRPFRTHNVTCMHSLHTAPTAVLCCLHRRAAARNFPYARRPKSLQFILSIKDFTASCNAQTPFLILIIASIKYSSQLSATSTVFRDINNGKHPTLQLSSAVMAVGDVILLVLQARMPQIQMFLVNDGHNA